MFFDPLYLVFALPGLLLGMWAQSRVKSAFNKYSRVRTMRNVTGAEVARALLDAQGLYDVVIEETKGFLSDHYDPRSKVLRLSPDVYRTPSIAAAGVAAHEMGHALQDAASYAPLNIRSALVPAVQFGSTLGPWVFIGGFMLQFTTLAWVGIALFAASVGLVQNDLKRVIAYSTCSQLGYMFFSCGLSHYSVGFFHLANHAFFKALLFLGAGSVIHSVNDNQDV